MRSYLNISLPLIATAVALLVITAAIAVLQGAVPITMLDVAQAFQRAATTFGEDALLPIDRIILQLRLPRVLIALLIGAGLGVVGAMLQTVTRNDLADPFLFGLSSGAAAGAVFVITVSGDQLGLWTLPISAFIGGVISASAVTLLVNYLGDSSGEKLILAGLGVSFLFSSLTNYMVFAGDQRAAHSVLFWSLGGLGLARWSNILLIILGFSSVVFFAMWRHRQLDALLSGEIAARSLGVDVKRLRIQVFLVSAFGTAIFVSVAGVIGFIGLMVPHIARSLVGPLHKGVIVFSALLGAFLLLASDLLARIILAPQEVPVGIVTTSIGAIFVFIILIRSRS